MDIFLPLTLTNKLDLDILPLNFYANIHACMPVFFGPDSETDTLRDTQTDRHMMSKLLHPSRQRHGM